ncbi:MAG: type II toxin-antitoxin system HigB family toxin [Chitinophagaceae bacterium]
MLEGLIQTIVMVIISKGFLNQFIGKNPTAAKAVWKWYQEAKTADWGSFSELKKTFGSADYAENGLVIFNVGGNKYRIIARVIFRTRTLFIKFIGTHAQYNKVILSDL